MSRHGDIEFDWGGEQRRFRLALGEIRKLQERTNAGPFELLRRLTSGSWRIDDLRETVRLGLEGAEVTSSEAGRLVRDYIDGKPLLESVMVAARILEAALSGAPDELIPKSEEAEVNPQSLKTESSPSPPSTDGDLLSATRQEKSTGSRSGNSRRAKRDTSPAKVLKTSPTLQAPQNTTIS